MHQLVKYCSYKCYILPSERAINIDTEIDVYVAEKLLSKKK